MSEDRFFSYKSARSGSLVVGILLVLVSEGLGMHLWIQSKNPWAAFAFDLVTLSTIAFVILEYRALAKGVIRLNDEALDLRVGRQFRLMLPRSSIASVQRPNWRDLPQAGMPQAADYLHLMRSATPNVLVVLRDAVPVKRPFHTRQVRRIGIHVDDPDGFVTACSAHFQQAEYGRSSTTPKVV
jgi:hypothetical protein